MKETLAEIRAYIKGKLKTERYRHSIGVMETARELAVRYGEDPMRAQLAGILHDCGKQYGHEESLRLMDAIGYVPNEVERFSPTLLHGRIGALLARERFAIGDDGILSAIACHTTGKVGMDLLDKIIYVADYIEPNRDGDWVYPMRTMAFRDLDGCLILCADSTLTYEMKKGNPIHPDTLRMRNAMLIARKGAADAP
jgi:predicted HD superfamily hydrolase involved in NAD metabolism